MSLQCANCGSKDKVDVVCHHCGKPLCEDELCRYLIDRDQDFSSGPAFHCRECRDKHHSKSK